MHRGSFLNRIIYSFPIQLFVLFFKKNHILMLYWILLFGFITDTLASRWGIPYLFLDPEYMGRVDCWSFLILGGAFGGFIMTYNISSYILNGYRFPFLATLSRPFFKFILNNCIVPLVFLSVYLYNFVNFQLYNEYQSYTVVLGELAGFLAGLILVISATLAYFTSTNKDIFKMFGISVESEDNVLRAHRVRNYRRDRKKEELWRVDTYLSSPLNLRLVRGTQHYDSDILMSVFRQNHLNAAVLELLVFSIFILLGLFRETSFFRIPTAASLTLLFCMFIMLLSAFRFWLRAWANFTLMIFFLVFNFASGFEILNPVNKAYGLNYSTKVPYTSESLIASNDTTYAKEDFQYTLETLEKWKQKATGGDTSLKPKLIFLNTSGGGLRAALWTYRVMQVVDSLSKGKVFRHTELITGASGGMIGAGYFRELYLRKEEKKIPTHTSDEYFNLLGKDLLNPIALSITVSDLFFRVQRFKDGKYEYTKDRAYAFERQLNENVNGVFGKRLKDYLEPEHSAQIPMMVITPTIINDGRRMFVAPHSLAYLSTPVQRKDFYYKPIPEGLNFIRFFKANDAENLRFTTALRMNATFPYIMPNVSLPSEPTIEVMDAGVRDNFGVRTSLKFLFVFRDWLEKNTSGVIFLQIRDTPHNPEFSPNPKKSIVQSFTTPIGSFYGNFPKIQQYNHDEYFQFASSWFKNSLDVVVFELPNEKEKVSLSWRLTTREKDYIYKAIHLRPNRLALKELNALLAAER